MTTLLIRLVKWTTDDAGTADPPDPAAVIDVNPTKTVTAEISYTDNLHRDKTIQEKYFNATNCQMKIVSNSITFPGTEPPIKLSCH
jgi:hypothetical protein